MLHSAVYVLVVAQSSSEVPEGLMNNPVQVIIKQSQRLKTKTYLLKWNRKGSRFILKSQNGFKGKLFLQDNQDVPDDK